MSNDISLNRLQGSTPSRLASETPNWVRIVGFVGMVVLALSVVMYILNARAYCQQYDLLKNPSAATSLTTGPAKVYPLVWIYFVVGLLLMLFQASRETDKTQRRILGGFGMGVFCLGMLIVTNLLVNEAVKTWLSSGAEANLESATQKGMWAGLAATLVMAFVLLIAWVAPFVRTVSQSKVSLLGFPGAWIKQMGQPLVASCTLFGFLGLGVLAAGAFFLKDVLSVYAEKGLAYSLENRLAYGSCSYGILFMLVGLPFMLIFANTEDEQSWAKAPTSLLGIVGIVTALVGMLGFITDLLKIPDYVLPYGFVLSLMGIFYIVLYISQRGDNSKSSVTLARWTGYTGLIVLVVAVVRSMLPAVVETTWMQEHFESLENLNLTSYLVPNGFLYMLLGAIYLLVGRLFCSENKLLIMTRRELASYFSSPIGYIILGATLIVAWFVFNSWLNDLTEATNMGAAYPEPVVAPYFFDMWIIIFMLIAIPMMTMRLMSEENRAGTVEVLMTAPVDEFSIVMSKFLAGWLYVVMIFLAWAIYPILLRIAGQEAFDFRPIMSCLLGLSLVAFGFVAMGLFFSTITKNQVVALLLTFAGMLVIFMLYFVERTITSGRGADPNSTTAEFLRYISFVHHVFLSFARGKVEFKQILFHLSFGAFWLFLTMRVLESRKWR